MTKATIKEFVIYMATNTVNGKRITNACGKSKNIDGQVFSYFNEWCVNPL